MFADPHYVFRAGGNGSRGIRSPAVRSSDVSLNSRSSDPANAKHKTRDAFRLVERSVHSNVPSAATHCYSQ